MTWKKIWSWSRKKEEPNRLRKKPTIAFRSDLSPEALYYIKKLALQKEKSEFINRAIDMRYYFLNNKERFISDIVRENFELTKHLLRQEGSKRNAVTKE